MQNHVLMHPSLQVAKRKPQRRRRSDLVLWVSLVPAGCTCAVPNAGSGWRKILFVPLMGSLDPGQSSLKLQFGHKAPYFASSLRDI